MAYFQFQSLPGYKFELPDELKKSAVLKIPGLENPGEILANCLYETKTKLIPGILNQFVIGCKRICWDRVDPAVSIRICLFQSISIFKMSKPDHIITMPAFKGHFTATLLVNIIQCNSTQWG